MTGIKCGMETYYHRSLQFVNEGTNPWPEKTEAMQKHEKSVLLNVMLDRKTICNVDFNGRVELMEGKTGENVIAIIALILARQQFK